MNNLLCKLIGHKAIQYLQVNEIDPNGEAWMENGNKIDRKIMTFFICQRCFYRYKQSEIFIKEEVAKV